LKSPDISSAFARQASAVPRSPDAGYLQIRKGKTEFRKRSLPITSRAKEVLTAWIAKSI